MAVVGGGIGGLAAAAFLCRAGLEVSVFEQARELREIGAALSAGHRTGLSVQKVRGLPVRKVPERRWRDSTH